MTSVKQPHRKPLLFVITLLGVAVLTIGFVMYFRTTNAKIKNFLPLTRTYNSLTPTPLSLAVEGVTVASRGPVLNEDKSGKEEITATVRGRFEVKNTKPEQLGLVAFWRLPSSSTNWYLAKRRVDGKYQVAVLDGKTAAAGSWDFEIGGIEVDKTYQGPIILVLLAFKRDLINARQKTWLEENHGDGFVEIPQLEARIDSSAPATFATSPVR